MLPCDSDTPGDHGAPSRDDLRPAIPTHALDHQPGQDQHQTLRHSREEADANQRCAEQHLGDVRDKGRKRWTIDVPPGQVAPIFDKVKLIPVEAILVVDQAVEDDQCHRHPDQDGGVGRNQRELRSRKFRKQGIFPGAGIMHGAVIL